MLSNDESLSAQSLAVCRNVLEALETIDLDHTVNLKDLHQRLSGLESTSKVDSRGRFVWNDSLIIKAMLEGSWIICENANLCNAAALDRLNSLLEVGGDLTLTECGLVNGEIRRIRPHANFRIFFTMDPKFGEVSRALRNRCCEFFVPDLLTTIDQTDFLKITSTFGCASSKFSAILLKKFSDMKLHGKQSFRSLVSWAQTSCSRIASGLSFEQALSDGFRLCAGLNLKFSESEIELDDLQWPWRDLPSETIRELFRFFMVRELCLPSTVSFLIPQTAPTFTSDDAQTILCLSFEDFSEDVSTTYLNLISVYFTSPEAHLCVQLFF